MAIQIENIRVENIMDKAPVTIGADWTVFQGLKQLVEHTCTSALVIDKTKAVLGCFSQQDALHHLCFDYLRGAVSDQKVKTVMQTQVLTTSPGTGLKMLLERLLPNNKAASPVSDTGILLDWQVLTKRHNQGENLGLQIAVVEHGKLCGVLHWQRISEWMLAETEVRGNAKEDISRLELTA